jgi:MoaA/NifB/PqqE/SkfB family radical SAM enzyme
VVQFGGGEPAHGRILFAMKLSILYRGPLSSCNYGCPYCPFAKHRESDAEHAADAQALQRFIDWIEAQDQHQIGVFFTPWGEALIRKRYQRALIQLTNMAHVTKAAIQTNGSCRWEWVEECDKSKLGLWVTYHPGETSRQKFTARCAEMLQRGVRFSVGVVGLKEHFAEIAALRAELPSQVYLWVNAFKRIENYYDAPELDFLENIDPLFPFNAQRHASLHRPCRAGHSVFSVDGNGVMRRCHFIKTPIGNIYDPHWMQALQERACTNQSCGCHIGYVHRQDLPLYQIFGDGVLERIPQSWSGTKK